jgi:hypothetical protein
MVIEDEGFGQNTLEAALLVKRVSAQIDVPVHAIGILSALPYIPCSRRTRRKSVARGSKHWQEPRS